MSEDINKTYWKGSEERERTAAFEAHDSRELSQPLTIEPMVEMETGISRRSFLKAAGFSITGSLLASCVREPVEKAIPVLIQAENMMPGKAYWYASTCGGCQAGCGILTKNREGRPIKIEGNTEHPISQGGLCAVGQAMVLGLYDSQRLKQPLMDGAVTDWSAIDTAIGQQLSQTQDGVYLLTGTITSPTTQTIIDRFLGQYNNSRHIISDAVSYSAILDAHEQTHGERVLPHYLFEHAEVIVSLDADFLGTWISPVEFTKGYMKKRTLDEADPQLSYHVQLEGRMSLTGSNADRRILLTPDEISGVLQRLAAGLAQRAGVSIPQLDSLSGSTQISNEVINDLADRLWQARGRGLVVCGMNDVGTQCLVNAINHLLGNYGATLDIEHPSYQWQSNDGAMQELLEALRADQVNALLIADTNPAYSLPDAQEFIEAMKQVPLTISLSTYLDETAAEANFVCPVHHPLESWNDAEIVEGIMSVSQPAIRPLGRTRTLRECLNAWMGTPQDDLAIFQTTWQEQMYPRRTQDMPFQKFWDQAVHDGFTLVNPQEAPSMAYRVSASWPSPVALSIPNDQFALVLYEKIGLRDGRHAHNPWLQELPDPITKVVWENYVCVAPATAERLGYEEGDIIRISSNGMVIDLPVQIQPGQHERVVAIAVGYGRSGTDRFSKIGPQWIESQLTVEEGGTVGENSFAFATRHNNSVVSATAVSLSPTGQKTNLALTQTHHTITVPDHLGGHRRNMVRETTLASYRKDPASGNHPVHEARQLWADDYPYTGHHWGLAIDLQKCTGCSACAIACQAENNVSVVGKDEVYRRREMHWIRIDRYYSGTDSNPDVMYQPVMCQHCDNAPCEAVCPVLATVHSEEGLNQQVYNRCVGTRYCANNCPYKVRRFNWFEYWKQGEQEHMVLNPDVTTRTRGVMEKCSLCVQRIQEARGQAKRLDMEIADGDIQTACQQSCPADAIVFGDMNDPDSRVSRLINHPRHYRMLEEMNYRTTVGYLTKIRNRDEESNHG
jgi:molybdopterin-containing oxidoreductase family iron-sulfur binding subunit